jgi:hypothetical protein
MVTWFCVTPERRAKTTMIMSALACGWPDARVIEGPPPDDDSPFVIWGQLWLALDVIPRALAQGRPFWHIDNGYWNAAKGGPNGFYRITYRGLSPIALQSPPLARGAALGPRFAPWRTEGTKILFALPSGQYGRCIGLDMPAWGKRMGDKLREITDRPVIIRSKDDVRPLKHDLRECWCVVTHSSNVAVDAVLAGLPVFVAPTSPAAPVGNLSLKSLEYPDMPDRSSWWASLMCQQFTLEEMKDGTAYDLLKLVQEQIEQ